MTRRVVVVGGGVTGLTAAWTLLSRGADVTVIEASPATGGLIRTSPFAGLPSVDEGADSFLRRVPHALALADEIGLADDLVSPTGAHAAIWHDGLHPIPVDIVLGVPASMRAVAGTRLFSPLGKARAALDTVLPRRDHGDCLGRHVRARFGTQVQERLVDPLVGSIYAADTDDYSLAAVPQIAALAAERSMLAAAATARRSAPRSNDPVFAAPRAGMGALVTRLAERITSSGGRIVSGTSVQSVERAASGYVVHASDGAHDCDAVVLASPARATAPLVAELDPAASALLARWVHATVVMVTLALPADQWPRKLTGSGYLVPKPDQRWLTAASFTSNKWDHLRPDDGSMVLRASLGRDGLVVDGFDDDTLVNLTLADLKHHLGVDFTPTAVRLTRWNASFPQYRPGHFDLLARVEASLAVHAPGVVLAGASYRGIGVPACVQQGRAAADKVLIAQPD